MNNTKPLAILLMVAALCGCQIEEKFEPVATDLVPLNINGQVNQVPTKATAAGFVNGDGLGLYAVNYSEGNTASGVLAAEGNQADNVKYVFDETNQKWNPVHPVYYKDINTHVDLYVYYPYAAGISDVAAYNFEVKQDQSAPAQNGQLCAYEASDFMWCKATDITPSESRVRVILDHKLAGVNVILSEGTGFAEGEFESLTKGVLLNGTTRKASIDFSTGVASPIGSAQQTGIVMAPQEDGSFRAVVIPQTVAGGTKLFSITIDGISYSYSKSSSTAYESGKMSQFTLTLNKKTPAGDYELVLTDAQILPWTEDRNTHDGEARQYYVANVETPGTLQAVIEAAGKNPAKIRNLKVTGTITTSDFYFMRDKMTILEAVNLKEVKIVNARTKSSTTQYLMDDVIPYYAFYDKKSLCYFSFPEQLCGIGEYAFYHSSISGALIIPDGVSSIGYGSFSGTKIGSVQFPEGLKIIDHDAFYECRSLTGDLLIPDSVTIIGNNAFSYTAFKGRLSLSENLESVGSRVFLSSGSFTGDLKIPDKITTVPSFFIRGSRFTGRLILNNVTTLSDNAFSYCHFIGDLVIPEGVVTIPQYCFYQNDFSSISFPSTLRDINDLAFWGNKSLSGEIVFPEGLINIGSQAFYEASMSSVVFPSTLQSLGNLAFYSCTNISNMCVNATEPPSILGDVFSGVTKDNFNVEVPAQSVKKYRGESGWSEFKRITAHYDFALSRPLIRGLNAQCSRTLVLRAPSGFAWSVEECPDWVTVTPSSGVGKTDVTITLGEMARTSELFEINEGPYNKPSFKKYKGRSGEVVFKLDEKDYTFTLDVEQYDYDYSDGVVRTLQTASCDNGIDIVFIGDGYDAKDIASGAFLSNAEAGYVHLFDVEPYKSYKDYFNVYAVMSMSDESGIGTLNTVVDNKFGSYFTQDRMLAPNADVCFSWARKANPSMELSKSLVIMMQNTSTYEGVTLMYADGSAIACCPVSSQPYPYDYRGIIQHEAGGHGFGKLGDEYIYHNAFIQNCACVDGCDHGNLLNMNKARGWYKNLSMTADPTQVPWSHLIYHPQYSDYVDMFEGGYMHTRGVYRSEATSCMNNNIPYYSAISRQAIVERIMDYVGEEFTLEKFYAKDNDDFGPMTKSAGLPVDRTFGVDPMFVRTTGHGPIYMGEHPNVK